MLSARALGYWILAVLLLASPVRLLAQAPTYYDFHPRSIMSLGQGFSIENLGQARQKCVNYEEHPYETGNLGTSALIYMVSDSQQLRKALSMDSSVEVSYLTFKGSSTFSFSEENIYSSNDISLVMKFSTEYPRVGMKNATLVSFAQDLLDKGLVTEFAKECGTQMVLVERRGASASIIVTLRQEDNSVRSRLAGSLSGGMDLGAISGEMKATLKGEMDRAAQEQRLSIQVLATGGDGFGKLSDTIKELAASEKDLFSRIQTAMGEYIKCFTKDNSAPIGFYVGSMLKYSTAQDDLWSLEKERLLSVLVEQYRTYTTNLDDMNGIILSKDPRSQIYTPAQVDELKQLVDPVQRYLSAVAAAHKDCKATKVSDLQSCGLPSGKPTLPSFFVPILPPIMKYSIIVDGRLLGGLEARAVFEDPGGGTLMKRVLRRIPNAKTADRVFIAEGQILDATLLVGTTNPFQMKVLYPGMTIGNSLVNAGAQKRLLMTVADTGKTDINLARTVWAYANRVQCTPDGSARILFGGQAPVFLRARDLLGNTRTAKIADAVFGPSDHFAAWNGAAVVPGTGEETSYFKLPDSDTCEDSLQYYLGSETETLFQWCLRPTMKEKVMEPVCWKGSSPSSTGARIEENYRCLVCRESAGKTSWEESDSKFCVSCAEKAGKYVAPKPIGSMDSDCLYKGAVYGELSYINGSGQCQQCQKGAWVDVDCQNCSTHNSPKHN